jgi:hypothetical protein
MDVESGPNQVRGRGHYRKALSMDERVVTTPVKYARRMPDPNFEGAERHFLLVPAGDVPEGLLRGANPRDPEVSRPVYRQVARSLAGQDDSVPGSFHLKHRGIKIIADDVRKSPHKVKGLEQYEIHFPPEDEQCGIVDGGHSYRILLDAKAKGTTPPDQFVELQVLTGVPDTLVTDIAGGLNTSMQVQLKSLEDLKHSFEFLKKALGPTLTGQIAWHEGDDGDVDVVDVMAMLSCFDTITYPGRESHPVDAYRRKKSQLELFTRDPDKFKRLAPIAKDVLYLHDWIAYDSIDRWQEVGGVSGSGGKYRSLDMVERADHRDLEFTFIGKRSDNRLRRPAVFPILGAFRVMVEDDPRRKAIGDYPPARWHGGFESVMSLWSEVGGSLLRIFYDHWASTGRDLHAAGRSTALWNALYTELTLAKMERAQREMA